MTEDPTSLWGAVKAALMAIPAFGAALWGGLGGATNALVIRVTWREAVLHIAIGAVIAAGLGGPLVAYWLNLPPDTIARSDWAAGGSGAYLAGSLGAAIFEVVLTRIRAGRLPNDRP